MKKLLTILFIVLLSTAISAQLSSKQLVGKWKYTVTTDQGDMTGIFKFTETEGKLAGEVLTSEGYVIPFTKIELREGNVLYLELKTDSDNITVTVKIEGDKFKGTGTSYQGEAPITGVKQKE